jgi:hypothetical protein
MTEQTAGPDGIEQQLDAGVAAGDQEPELDPEDARSRGTLRTDPDDPAAGLAAAEEASKEPSEDS